MAEEAVADGPPAPRRAAVGWLWRTFAALVVALRIPILAGWIAAAALATLFLPALSASGSLSGLVSGNSPAVRAELDAARLFGVPLASAEVDIVQRDPAGFPKAVQTQVAWHALAADKGHTGGIPGLRGALPITNTGGVVPSRGAPLTTIVTFLFFRPGMAIAAQTSGAEAYAHRYLNAPGDHLVGVTGPVPAEQQQTNLIAGYLPWVEGATLLAIGLIVGIYFRSPGPPLASLACSAVAYLVAVRLVGWIARRAGLTVPPDLEPVLVVLLLGVTTDYSVFFLAGTRARLASGLGRVQAARHTTAEFAPIIVTAGVVVAAGIASLGVARIAALQAFGPALALTVLIGMAVAVTLTPAITATFGGLLFRSRRLAALAARRAGRPRQRATWRGQTARVATTRPVAALATMACVAGLGLGAVGLTQIRLGFPLIRALPAQAQAARAQAAATKGFAPGILAPTEVLVIGPGVARQQAALVRLQHALATRRGVAAALGPADFPALAHRFDLHVFRTASGGAARYVLIERTDPLEPRAIGQVAALTKDLPSLARAAGLHGARFEVGGETALAGQAIAATASSLWRIALLIGVVIVILLALFLRSMVAPLYLIAASVLALLCALGVTVWIFQVLLGQAGLVYYVPFAAAVLLISLGSDYNVFVVGRIWEEARLRPLREAVATAAPRASRTITVAALSLAAGFATLALVPLAQFRELATAMVLGVLIDALAVRSVLVPALVILFGDAGRWPGGRRSRLARQRPAAATKPKGAGRPLNEPDRAGLPPAAGG